MDNMFVPGIKLYVKVHTKKAQIQVKSKIISHQYIDINLNYSLP